MANALIELFKTIIFTVWQMKTGLYRFQKIEEELVSKLDLRIN